MRRFLVVCLFLLAGCSTDRSMSTMMCMQYGISSPQCITARQQEEQKSSDKTTGTTTGAIVGCVLTGPFCLLGVGPLVGGLVGNSMSGNQSVIPYIPPAPAQQPVQPAPTMAQQPTQAKIPDAIKRNFRLIHIKGPIVSTPPSVLSAEYFDSGEGHGPAHVTYPGNYTLDGEYRTMAVSQSFKGLVNARLINPDRVINLPDSALKGFVAFGGVDGIILECVYASTSDSSKGVGDCADNRGNQYTLDF